MLNSRQKPVGGSREKPFTAARPLRPRSVSSTRLSKMLSAGGLTIWMGMDFRVNLRNPAAGIRVSIVVCAICVCVENYRIRNVINKSFVAY